MGRDGWPALAAAPPQERDDLKLLACCACPAQGVLALSVVEPVVNLSSLHSKMHRLLFVLALTTALLSPAGGQQEQPCELSGQGGTSKERGRPAPRRLAWPKGRALTRELLHGALWKKGRQALFPGCRGNEHSPAREDCRAALRSAKIIPGVVDGLDTTANTSLAVAYNGLVVKDGLLIPAAQARHSELDSWGGASSHYVALRPQGCHMCCYRGCIN